jgi:hypothetical protein
VLACGAVLAACGSSSPSAAPPSSTTSSSSTTTTTTSGSGSLSGDLAKFSSLSTAESGATFQATYTYTSGGPVQTMTFAQSPPKAMFKDSAGGLVVETGTAGYYCGSGTCYKTTTATDPLASLFYLFDGKTFYASVAEYRLTAAYLAAHGYTFSFSTASYAGQASQCITVTQTTGTGKTVTSCVASNGLMTSVHAGKDSFTLTSFTSSPPSSDFALPPGAKVTSLP